MALIGASVAVVVVWLVMTEGRWSGAGGGRLANSAAPTVGSAVGVQSGASAPGSNASNGAGGARSTAQHSARPAVASESAIPAPPIAAGPSAPAAPGAAAAATGPVAAFVASASVAAGGPPLARDCPPTLTVAFGFDSAVPARDHIGGEGAPLLRWLAAHPGAKLSVQGHADAVGSDRHNLLLSYQRARAVAAQLAAAGVGGPRLSLSAAGSHEPIDGLPEAARENRRAVIRVRGYEDCDHATR